MHPDTLTAYLHRHIPLSRAMRVRVIRQTPAEIRLHAPLRPNRNHQGSAFGGSVAALALLAGWALLHVRLRAASAPCALVVQRLEIDYVRPVTGPLEACARWAEAGAWDPFERALRNKGKGRIRVIATLEQDRRPAARLVGTFVAFSPTPRAGRVSSNDDTRRRAAAPRRSS